MIVKAYYSDELYHYGVKGMKWGVRKDQNNTKVHQGDIVIKKGSKYGRITLNQKENFDTRLYVSKNPISYATLPSVIKYVINGNKDKVYVDIYETNKDLIVAGKDSVDRILKDIGEKPVKYQLDFNNRKNKDWVNWTDPDFLNRGRKNSEKYNPKNDKLVKKFIKEAKKQGYSAIVDPEDAINAPIEKTATIFIDKQLNKIGSVSLEEALKEDPRKYYFN